MNGLYYIKNTKWNLSEPTEFDSKRNRIIHTWMGLDAEFQSKIN
jgi:hypothetical protein